MEFPKTSASDWPLRSSLFWTYQGKPRCTWDYLARDTTHMTDAMLQAQGAFNSNLFTFICYNMVDPKVAVVNPFRGNPVASEIVRRLHPMQDVGWDDAEVKRWGDLLQIGKVPGVFLVPTIFCGDDAATTQNEEFVNAYSTIVVRTMHPYVAGFSIATEASKSMDRGRMERMINNCKAAFDIEPKLTPKPITAHLPWNRRDQLPGNMDFLMYEYSWNPWDGDKKSVEEVLRETNEVLAAYPGQVWFQEMNVHCESQRAREQVRAIRDLARTEPRIIGLPGPA